MFYLMLMFVDFYRFSGKLYTIREKTAMFSSIVIFFVGIICRNIACHMLLIDRGILLSSLIYHIVFINPDIYLDRNTLLFNKNGFLTSYTNTDKNIAMNKFYFRIKRYSYMRCKYGIQQMDESLLLISEYLRKEFPKAYFFYLRGGEFIVMTDESDERSMIDKIRKRFDLPWISENANVSLEVSFAIIRSENVDQYSSNTVFRAITEKLDNDFHTGDIAVIDDNILEKNSTNIMMVQNIESYIVNNNVEVFLQPIMSAATNKLEGAEALCRIKSEQEGYISPGIFIPIAEKTGKIVELGEVVFENTCRFISENDIDSIGIKWVNINVSPLQLLRPDLSERFLELIDKYNVDIAKIHLEITESSMIEYPYMKNQVDRMVEAGFKISLDDYGTGYSNIVRVKQMPFANIKMDMSLVWDYINNPDPLLPMTIKMFKEMGYSITCEGIETIEMAEAMKQLGCDYLQGKNFSMPIPMPEFIKKYSD